MNVWMLVPLGLVLLGLLLRVVWPRYQDYRWRKACIRRLEEAWAPRPKYFQGLE